MNDRIKDKNSSLREYREQRFLKAFELREKEKLTYVEIGKRFGISGGRASQLVARGARVIKHRKILADNAAG